MRSKGIIIARLSNTQELWWKVKTEYYLVEWALRHGFKEWRFAFDTDDKGVNSYNIIECLKPTEGD